jgi:hypothetical protein
MVGDKISANPAEPPNPETTRRRVYLAYAANDHSAADTLAWWLEQQGHEVFFAPRAIRLGEDWKKRLRAALLTSDELAIFWSDSASKSKWVRWEIETFLVGAPERPITTYTSDEAELTPVLQTRQSFDLRRLIPQAGGDSGGFHVPFEALRRVWSSVRGLGGWTFAVGATGLHVIGLAASDSRGGGFKSVRGLLTAVGAVAVGVGLMSIDNPDPPNDSTEGLSMPVCAPFEDFVLLPQGWKVRSCVANTKGGAVLIVSGPATSLDAVRAMTQRWADNGGWRTSGPTFFPTGVFIRDGTEQLSVSIRQDNVTEVRLVLSHGE